eukprot:COSAG05_NODE_2245_length_3348_cov_3.885503_2_plen_95_part_00
MNDLSNLMWGTMYIVSCTPILKQPGSCPCGFLGDTIHPHATVQRQTGIGASIDWSKAVQIEATPYTRLPCVRSVPMLDQLYGNQVALSVVGPSA